MDGETGSLRRRHKTQASTKLMHQEMIAANHRIDNSTPLAPLSDPESLFAQDRPRAKAVVVMLKVEVGSGNPIGNELDNG